MQPGAPEYLTLRDYLSPVAARRWLVLGIVVLVTAGTYAYYARQRPTYSATTKIYVAQEGNPLVGVGAGYSDDRSVENQATLLTSVDVASVVAKKIGYRGSAANLSDRVSASPSKGADFITITGHGTSGEEAARITNGFAQAFIDVRSADRRGAAEKGLTQLRKQLQGIPRTPSTASERAEIASNIRQLQVAAGSGAGNARQIDPARAASSPLTRPAWQKALLAGLVALIGSIFLAYMLHRLDPRLKTVEEAAAIYRRPIMASILHDGGIDCFANGLPALSTTSKEAFRQLRVNLDLSALDRPFRTILITSAGPGEGKSTVARNLALAIHEAGRRVALVDADLRKPTLPTLLGVDPGEGLTNVLAGEHRLDEVITDVDVSSHGVAALERMAVAGGDRVAGSNGRSPDTLRLLTAGPTPPNPSAVLESTAMLALLQELSADHDAVVIDSAPLAAVSDAIPLLARVDAVLLVSRTGRTDRRSARHAAEIISRVPDANLAGVVVNDLGGAEASAYGTGYGYGYGYGDRETPRQA